jgi:hypothetical protein
MTPFVFYEGGKLAGWGFEFKGLAGPVAEPALMRVPNAWGQRIMGLGKVPLTDQIPGSCA